MNSPRINALWQKAMSAFVEPPLAQRPLYQLSRDELIQLESEIGRQLFGPIPAGHRREFFNADPASWIWYEEWRDMTGRVSSMTTRYEVRADGVWKVQEGARYVKLAGPELDNLVMAIRLYHERVMREIYSRAPQLPGSYAAQGA